MDAARTVAAALAVRDGRIVAVGSDAAAGRWIGPQSRVVELRGRTVTPGFGDAHVHPASAGVGRLRCDLEDLRGLDAYLAAVAGYAASHPDAPWIVGDGWSMADFPGGIPDEILTNSVDHRKPYLDPETGEPADLGVYDTTSITFEPRPEVSSVVLDPLYRALDALP